MYKTLYPSRDSCLYSRHPERNTGADQILELTKITSGSEVEDIIGSGETWSVNYNSRILIDFNITEVSNSMAAGTITNAKFYLTLKATEATHLPIEYTLYAHPISGSWTNGTGYYNNNAEVTNGVSWKYRHGKAQGTQWVSWGGDYYTASAFQATQTFNYEHPDVRIDVSKIVNAWVSGSLKRKQHGFILKHSNAVESGSTEVGSIKFFSKDTHTVYIPRLEVYWKDVDVSGTGSIAAITGNEYVVYAKNLRESYMEGEVTKLRLGVRERFPTASYSTTNAYLINKRLPYNSFFQIMDSRTDEVIIPFNDPGTRVSCDTTGNYVKLDMNSFLPERFYKVVFKVEQSGGIVDYFDEGFWFKVKRN